MEKKYKGSASELIATVWLLKKGYEVFRNVSPHGTVDIIAKNPRTAECIFIDVTTIMKHKRKDGSISYNYIKNIDNNPYINAVVVDIEANKVYWGYDKIFNSKVQPEVDFAVHW